MVIFVFQRVMRGLLCNVFTELRNDFSLGSGGNHQAIFEYYFLAVSVRPYKACVLFFIISDMFESI